MNKNRNRIHIILSLVIPVLTVLLSGYLFYRYIYIMQSSDFPAHIKSYLAGKTYSVNRIIMPIFYKLTGSNMGIVIMMGMIIAATIIGFSFFIKMIGKALGDDRKLYEVIPLACSLLFICKLCIPEWSPYFYQGSFSSQPWHNSTYIEMRLFAIPTLMMYFLIRKDYLKRIRLKDCILFTLFLFLTNLSKPNFMLAFSPVMLVVLIIDFIRTRGKSFKNAFVFGVCVLITVAIIYTQYNILFPSTGNSRIIISASHALEVLTKDRKMPLHLLLNYAYPLYMSFHIIKRWKDIDAFGHQLFIETWAMNVVTILISLFVTETGHRALDGNFEWGNALFALVLFMVCLILQHDMTKDGRLGPRQDTTAFNIYAAHIIFGIFYFFTLFIGYVSWIL